MLAKPVNCDCPAEFVFGILDTLPGSVEMAGCTKCGRTDLADPVVTEDQPHDVQFHGYRLLDLSDDARAWASAWARFVRLEQTRVYLPADARFQSVAERDAAVAAALQQQGGVPLREKLIALGVPAGPPPASLPEALHGFVEMWNGLQLNDATPIDELLDAATRFNGPNRLAADVLARRPDLKQLAALLLWDPDETRRKGGRYLVQEFCLAGDEVVVPLRCRLGELNDNQTGEMSSIFRLLTKMDAAARSAHPDVEAAAERVKDTDYYAHKEAIELIARWT